MNKVLIVEAREGIARAIAMRLRPMSYRDFLHAATEQDAVAAADHYSLSLVIIGDAIAQGSAIEAGRRIAARHEVPMLLATAHADAVRRQLVDASFIEGPFDLDEISSAVRLARTTDAAEAAR